HWSDADRGCPDGPPESVMYAPALREELTPLDVAALCAAFPKTEGTGAVAPRGCGCHLPGSETPATLEGWLLAIGVALASVRRRRRPGERLRAAGWRPSSCR
ncbi:MAG TPA: hypothetical protein PLU22_12065, partial [Polyangiaceae bacterium]|nr:hypothetical protein [Polyangiaceae bacterium]